MTYIPPQTSITEEVNSPLSIAPIIASPEDVVLVGPASSTFPKVTNESVTFPAVGKEIIIPYVASLNSFGESTVQIVTKSLNAVVSTGEVTYEETTAKKSVTKKAGEVIPEENPDKSLNYETNFKNGTIKNVASGLANIVLLLNYEWVSSTYFFPQRFKDISLIQAIYGPGIEKSVVKSPLTLAATFALGNGVGSVILQPLFQYNEVNKEEREAPVEYENKKAEKVGGVASLETWSSTFGSVLAQVENADFVVPIIGQTMHNVTGQRVLEVFEQTERLLSEFIEQQEVYAFGVFGEDGTGETIPPSELRTHAASLRNVYGGKLRQQSVFLNSTKLEITSPTGGIGGSKQFLEIGGQYAAAAFAGGLAGLPISSAFTRRNFVGFRKVNDHRTLEEKNLDAEAGLCVIEQFGNQVRCRHSITLEEFENTARSEVNVVRAKFNLIASIKQTLENQVIGKIIADGNSPFVVKSAIAGVLSSLQAQRGIVDYSPITAEISSTNPTTITARFSYRPSFIVNYINVIFSLNLSAQTITAETTGV